MLYNYQESLHKYKNDYQLNKAIMEGRFHKIEKGVYSDGENNFTQIEIVMKKYSNSFLVKDSAMNFYGLKKELPEKIHIGTARNALRIKDERITQHFYSGFNTATINEGEERYVRILSQRNLKCYKSENGNEIRLLNLKALAFDLIRDRNKYTEEDFLCLLASFKNTSLPFDFDTFEIMGELYEERIKIDKKLLNMIEEIDQKAFSNSVETEFTLMWREIFS